MFAESVWVSPLVTKEMLLNVMPAALIVALAPTHSKVLPVVTTVPAVCVKAPPIPTRVPKVMVPAVLMVSELRKLPEVVVPVSVPVPVMVNVVVPVATEVDPACVRLPWHSIDPPLMVVVPVAPIVQRLETMQASTSV